MKLTKGSVTQALILSSLVMLINVGCSKVDFGDVPKTAAQDKAGAQSTSSSLSSQSTPTGSSAEPTAPPALVPPPTPPPPSAPAPSIAAPVVVAPVIEVPAVVPPPKDVVGQNPPATPPGPAAPEMTTPPAPTPALPPPSFTSDSSAVHCQTGGSLPASFAMESAAINDVAAPLVSARSILQLSNIRSDSSVSAMNIQAMIVGIHGTLNVIASSIAGVSGVDKDLCATTNVFIGVIQNIKGHVSLASLGGEAMPAPLSQIDGVGSAELLNIHAGNVDNVLGDVKITNGGTVTGLYQIDGDVYLVNTDVGYAHDIKGTIYLKNSHILARDINSVKSIVNLP